MRQFIFLYSDKTTKPIFINKTPIGASSNQIFLYIYINLFKIVQILKEFITDFKNAFQLIFRNEASLD